MIWFRSRSPFGIVLALFALALQFGLSFGHHHQNTAFLNAKALTLSYAKDHLCAPVASSQDGAEACAYSQTPTPDDTDGPNGECAICAVLSLASAAVQSVAPSIQQPDAVEFRFAVDVSSYSFEDQRRSVFQPRGPPAT